MANEFFASAAMPAWNAPKGAKPFKIVRYPGAGVACVVEGRKLGGGAWDEQEAIAAAAQVNAGNEAGIIFEMYSDD